MWSEYEHKCLACIFIRKSLSQTPEYDIYQTISAICLLSSRCTLDIALIDN